MSDADPTLATINQLADEEHALRHKESEGTATDDDRARLAHIEVQLDQCWDLLRQRRARRTAGQDVDDVALRSEDTVEHYQQ
ncbi:MAG: DUF2630 family protein [Ilumatobacteraceae bacterium]